MNGTITAAELATILGRDKSSVIRRADKEEWPHEVGENRVKLYIIESLPPEIQERIFRYRNGIDEETVGEICDRMEISVPPAKLKDPAVATKIRMVCECLAVPQGARGRDARIGEIAEEYGYSKRSAYRLMQRVRDDLPLLTDTRNHGATIPELGITVRAWDEDAARMAVGALMENKRNKVEKLTLYNQVARQAEAQGLAAGSYGSFLDLARKIDPAILIYKDKGVRGLREDIVPAIRRDHTAYRAMECLIGDQHKADYYCFDHNGDVATLELFCWLDFRTQMAWGSIAYQHYNRYTVGHALTNAQRWGLSSIAYTDWGKPEESNYVTLLLKQLTGLGVRCEGIRHTRAKVRHPQAKPIESWFGWLDRNLRNAGIPGYCKRLRDGRENDLQQKELKELIREGGLLTIDDLVDRIFSVIDQWNEHAFKNRGVDNGKSPRELYDREIAIHPVAKLSDDILDYVFHPFQETKVRRSQVKIRHEFFKKTLTYYHPELSSRGGEAVRVRYNPFDPERVWVFGIQKDGKDGGLICAPEEWGMINPKNRDQVADRIAIQNRLVRMISDRYRALLPEKAEKGHVPRIHPQERQARAMKKEKRRAETALRICKTSLDGDLIDTRTGEVLPGRNRKAVGDWRSSFQDMFRTASNKGEDERPRGAFIRLDMNKPHDD